LLRPEHHWPSSSTVACSTTRMCPCKRRSLWVQTVTDVFVYELLRRPFHIGNFCFWVPFLKQLLLRNCAVNFVEICSVYVAKMIITAAERIFNSDKICRSYSDLNFGVTFFGTQYIWVFVRCEKTTVLSSDILNPQVSHQVEILPKLFCIDFVIWLKFLPNLNKQLSSANSEDSVSCNTSGRAFIMISWKSSGDIIKPWAVPLSNGYLSDNALPMLTRIHILSVGKFLMYLKYCKLCPDFLVLLPRCMECRRGLAIRILSVCLSVRHTRALWQNGRKICPDFYTVRKII